MARDIPVGNGRVLVTFDKDYQVRDVYYPHVGKENQAGRRPCKLGVWVDGELSWMGPDWDKTLKYRENSLVTDVVARNERLGIELHCSDCVDFQDPIFLREIIVRDLRGNEREVRLFFHHDLNLYDNSIGDTALYDPQERGILHYKDRRYVLMNVATPTRFGCDSFAVGEKGGPQHEGTWRDAEDGELGRNAVASGVVDSVMQLNLRLDPNGEQVCHFWMTFGHNYDEVNAYNTLVWRETPAELVRRTHNYWLLWANKEQMRLDNLPEVVRRQFIRSLLTLRTQTDIDGGILSGNDPEAIRYDGSLYSYVWPRDGALVSVGLDAAGYSDMARSFYLFCVAAQTADGYMMPKYHPDGTAGPISHAWVHNGDIIPPIQEDQTATVLYALWRHFDRHRDIDFIEPLYQTFVVEASEFLAEKVDRETHLPTPSWDFWDEHYGVHTATTCMTIAGLWAAGRFARAFGDEELARKYNTVADKMKEAMLKYLYHNDLRRFARSRYRKHDGTWDLDVTPDVSLIALWAGGVLPPHDERVVSTMEQLRDVLSVKTDVGGMMRYENDGFNRVSDEHGSPWLVGTIWFAQWEIARARSREDLDRAMQMLRWVCERALPSGVLPEQVNPSNGTPLSVQPSTLVHGKLVHVAILYLEKLEEIDPEQRWHRDYRTELSVYNLPYIPKEEVRHRQPEMVEVP